MKNSSQSDNSDKSKRLHLGCGTTILDGYTNIDFPQAEHTTIDIKADQYADITKLEYPKGTIAEVRHHHVMEHFDRAMAISLWLRWREWLAPGGVLMIETPDFLESAVEFLKTKDLEERGALLRHIFGSQEAGWAIHYDGWYKERFEIYAEALGFRVEKIVCTKNNLSKRIDYKLPKLGNLAVSVVPNSLKKKVGINTLPNVLFIGERTDQAINEKEAVGKILNHYLIGKEHTHEGIKKVWIENIESALGRPLK